jgi:hypothetical protein
MQATAFAGLDVHAAQTHAGILDHRTGELVRRRLKGEPLRAVLPFLEALGPGVRAVYEAGPTGSRPTPRRRASGAPARRG